ncbi:hypothetical protein QRQ56_25235 [Bradyrhizobium sp. U531]|uniref:hypothetical protein n=1 Tax=Bradyrhizobium sp. U531 TaxID=3053458 RepID=UPI003F43E80C
MVTMLAQIIRWDGLRADLVHLFPGLTHLGEARPAEVAYRLGRQSMSRRRSFAFVGMACLQVVQWRNDVKRVGEQSGGFGRLLVLRARDAQAFAELGVAYWLSRRKGHHARTREKARGGEVSGDERFVSLADERTHSGPEPKLKAARGA